MNAPLAFSAILALGTYGIENSLSLPFPPLSILAAAAAAGEKREAEAEVKGTEIDRALPTNLKEATIAMARKGGIARKVLGGKSSHLLFYLLLRQHGDDIILLLSADTRSLCNVFSSVHRMDGHTLCLPACRLARTPDAFVDHYAGTRQHEWKLWSEAVTDWYVLFRLVPPSFSPLDASMNSNRPLHCASH